MAQDGPCTPHLKLFKSLKAKRGRAVTAVNLQVTARGEAVTAVNLQVTARGEAVTAVNLQVTAR